MPAFPNHHQTNPLANTPLVDSHGVQQRLDVLVRVMAEGEPVGTHLVMNPLRHAIVLADELVGAEVDDRHTRGIGVQI